MSTATHETFTARSTRDTDEAVYSNFDHALIDSVVDQLRADPETLWAQHAAWGFCGYVWFTSDGQWREQVWVYQSPIAEYSDADLSSLIAHVIDIHGSD